MTEIDRAEDAAGGPDVAPERPPDEPDPDSFSTTSWVSKFWRASPKPTTRGLHQPAPPPSAHPARCDQRIERKPRPPHQRAAHHV